MSGWLGRAPEGWREVVDRAVAEDLGPGDLTARAFPEGCTAEWLIEAQGEGVLCGAGIVSELYMVAPRASDGQEVRASTMVAQGTGAADRTMTLERTALNFLMLLSGTATLTNLFVRAVEGTGVRIVDTRKTIPGMRALQKYAVRCGGGSNHRFGLFDGVMLKDTHLNAAGGMREAFQRVRNAAPHTVRIEVECTSPKMVEEAVSLGADVVMLDNMDVPTMGAVAREYRDRVILEASGGVRLETVRATAETGVHLISVGMLTHSAPALPFHMVVR